MSHVNKQHWPAPISAAWELVHSFEADGKKGAEAMAPRIGKRPHVLSNEVNADYPDAKLGLLTAYFIECEAGRFDILHAYAAMHGHACWQLPKPNTVYGDLDLLARFSEWQAAMGKTCNQIHAAFAHDSENGAGVSKKESAIVRAHAIAHVGKLMFFLAHLDAVSE